MKFLQIQLHIHTLGHDQSLKPMFSMVINIIAWDIRLEYAHGPMAESAETLLSYEECKVSADSLAHSGADSF